MTRAAITLRSALGIFWAEADAFVRMRLTVALVLVLSAGVLGGLAPIALKLAVDALSRGAQPTEYLTPALLIAGYAISMYLARAVNELKVLIQGGVERRSQRRLSRRLFAHIMSLPLRFHLDRRSGAIGQTLTLGLSGYQILSQQLLYGVIPVMVELGTICAVLVHLAHPAYGVLLGVSAVAYTLAFAVGAAQLAKPSRAVSAGTIDAHAVLTDSLLNYETVKYCNAESVVTARYDAALSRTEADWARFYRVLALNGLAVALIFAASLGAALTFGAREVSRGTMTVGDLVLVNAYVLQIARPLEMLGLVARNLSQGVAYLERMMALLHESPEPHRNHQTFASHRTAASLTFDEVTFRYHPERPVLENVTFSVLAGCSVAIVGVSGSGKSSLVRLLYRLYEPDSGRILLDGSPISQMTMGEVRDAIAVVPQDTVLLNDSIAHNIGLGKQGSTRTEIEKAARLAQLHEFILSLPNSYDTVVGERGLKLSGGEKQRIAIARAVLKQPRIYVFDEATSSLDSRTEREILGNLLDLSRTHTTITIAHRLSTISHVDEIIMLGKGVVVERGKHAQLLRQGGEYAAMWRAQQESPDSGAALAGDSAYP